MQNSILQEADTLINGGRAESYGPAKASFEKQAAGWAIILGVPITAKQVAMCHIWNKMSRELYKPKTDNLVDICGYAALAGEF